MLDLDDSILAPRRLKVFRTLEKKKTLSPRLRLRMGDNNLYIRVSRLL